MINVIVVFKDETHAESFRYMASRKLPGKTVTKGRGWGSERKVWLSVENDDRKSIDYFVKLAQQSDGFKEREPA